MKISKTVIKTYHFESEREVMKYFSKCFTALDNRNNTNSQELKFINDTIKYHNAKRPYILTTNGFGQVKTIQLGQNVYNSAQAKQMFRDSIKREFRLFRRKEVKFTLTE